MKLPRRQEDWMAWSLKGLVIALVCITVSNALLGHKLTKAEYVELFGWFLLGACICAFVVAFIWPDPKEQLPRTALRPEQTAPKKRRRLFRLRR